MQVLEGGGRQMQGLHPQVSQAPEHIDPAQLSPALGNVLDAGWALVHQLHAHGQEVGAAVVVARQLRADLPSELRRRWLYRHSMGVSLGPALAYRLQAQ